MNHYGGMKRWWRKARSVILDEEQLYHLRGYLAMVGYIYIYIFFFFGGIAV
jgi:hypothetical protein